MAGCMMIGWRVGKVSLVLWTLVLCLILTIIATIMLVIVSIVGWRRIWCILADIGRRLLIVIRRLVRWIVGN